MTNQITQRQQIVNRLKRGWCTGLQALECANTMKLASRVSELRRDGHVIIDRWVEHDGKRFKSYKML